MRCRRPAHLRTAKSCGPDAPTLAPSWRSYLRRRRWQTSPVTGESTKETVKTIACGNAGCSGATVVTTLVCYLHFAHEAAGAAGTPHSPRPLFSKGESFLPNSGASPRGNAKLFPTRRRPPPGRRLAPTDDSLQRAIQYSRDADDGIERPRHTGYPACAGYDDFWWGATQRLARRVQSSTSSCGRPNRWTIPGVAMVTNVARRPVEAFRRPIKTVA